MINVTDSEVSQYLRGYSYGIELYPPASYYSDAVKRNAKRWPAYWIGPINIRTPFQEGYWRGAFDYFCLLTGALPDEIG